MFHKILVVFHVGLQVTQNGDTKSPQSYM